MKLSLITAPAVLLCCALGTAAPALGMHSDTLGVRPVSFSVADSTQVPTKVLKAGRHSIRILDHLSDRYIVEVSTNGKPDVTFIAVPAPTMASSSGPIPYGAKADGKQALKGFAFPDGPSVEFVYPKDTAVAIAKANDIKVAAIDPESEGRPPALDLSASDKQMVTLWMLEPTRVGPNDATPAIAASKYNAPPVVTDPAPTTAAAAEPAPAPVPSPRPARRAATADTTQVAQNDIPAPPPARVRTTHVRQLPKTASDTPLVALLTLLSLGLAVTLRRFRPVAGTQR